MKLIDRVLNIEVSSYGEHIGDVTVKMLKEKLHWEAECKKALMESQVRLAARVRELEDALRGVLARCGPEEVQTDFNAARAVLEDRSWTKTNLKGE